VRAAWQPGLFGGGAAPRVASALSRPERIALDATSWVEMHRGWLAGADAVFEPMLTAVRWLQHDRRMFDRIVLEPRMTAEVRSLADAPHASLVEAARALSVRYGVEYDHLWLNLYRDGRDSTAWHGDHLSCRRDECIVPVLTLGATRRFLLKPRSGGRSLVLRPAAGDLVVMGGRCQRDWVHSVPKTAEGCGARISVNFQSSEQARPLRPAPAASARREGAAR
jgi:alkylated DNA repair dioxygenase AlkB